MKKMILAAKKNEGENSNKIGENVNYRLNETTGELVISGSGKMYDYSSMHISSASPFTSNTNIKTVIIENGVTTIGNDAFYGCSGLTNITIPDSVTTIGYGAFMNCSSLTSINIPDSVRTIENWAFNNCSRLTSINFVGKPESIEFGDISFRNTPIYEKMKKYIEQQGVSIESDMRDIVQEIHELTDFDGGGLTTLKEFVEEVIPQIEALLDEAKSLVR